MKFQKATKMIRLIILSSQLEDSAIYFCCLREMNTKKKKYVIKELYKNLITQLEQLPVPIFAEKTYKSYPDILLGADG